MCGLGLKAGGGWGVLTRVEENQSHIKTVGGNIGKWEGGSARMWEGIASFNLIFTVLSIS